MCLAHTKSLDFQPVSLNADAQTVPGALQGEGIFSLLLFKAEYKWPSMFRRESRSSEGNEFVLEGRNHWEEIIRGQAAQARCTSLEIPTGSCTGALTPLLWPGRQLAHPSTEQERG